MQELFKILTTGHREGLTKGTKALVEAHFSSEDFQEAVWSYRLACCGQKLKAEKAKAARLGGCVKKPRVTPCLREKELQDFVKKAKSFSTFLGKMTGYSKGCLGTAPALDCFQAQLKAFISKAEKGACEARAEKEVPKGPRNSAGKREVAVEALLVGLRDALPAGTKSYTIRAIARWVHQWACGRLRVVTRVDGTKFPCWKLGPAVTREWGKEPWKRVSKMRESR
jgi:hypothetical protein